MIWKKDSSSEVILVCTAGLHEGDAAIRCSLKTFSRSSPYVGLVGTMLGCLLFFGNLLNVLIFN